MVFLSFFVSDVQKLSSLKFYNFKENLNKITRTKRRRKLRMNKRIVKQSIAAALLTSSILSFAPVTHAKEMTIQQSIDAVKLEMKKAPLYYVDPALKSLIEPSKDLYPVLDSVKKHYKGVKEQIQSSNLSTKEKQDRIKELDSLYEEKITKGLIPYIDAYNYAVKYLDPILKEMLDAHAAGDLDGVEQAYHKLSYQLDSRTSILYRFTGKAPRDLLLEKYKKPSDAKRDELRIPVTIYMKNNEVLKLWNEGKKEEARKVMDEVLTLVSKASTDVKTNYSNLLSNEVKEAEALFSTLPTPTPTPTPEVPSNPSVGGGNNEAPSESAAERRLRIAKTNAISELSEYKKVGKDDYSVENWFSITLLKTTGTNQINTAVSTTEVTQALTAAKTAIDAVKTLGQEEAEQQSLLATAKNLAIIELTNHKNVVDYSSENWLLIQSAKETGTNEITTATTTTAVTQALTAAKTVIDAVKTLVQEEEEENRNQAPTVTNVIIGGLAKEGQVLRGTYTYEDNESDLEGTSTYKWYRSNDEAGTNKMEIIGATSNEYTLVLEDVNKYIFFEITPAAQSGVSIGAAVLSRATNQVQELSFYLTDNNGSTSYTYSVGTNVNVGALNSLWPTIFAEKPINDATVIIDLGEAFTADTNDKYAFSTFHDGTKLTANMISNNGRTITIPNVDILQYPDQPFWLMLKFGTKTLDNVGTYEITVTINGMSKTMQLNVTN